MNLFTTTQALQVINASLQRPISRQAFHQSVVPLLIQRGDAQHLNLVVVVDGDAVPRWAAYMAWREKQIDSGALSTAHPYSIEEMEDHFLGAHDE